MTNEDKGWDWWSEVKLDILGKYLEGFTKASKRALGTLYLDLFAGMYDNPRRYHTGTFPGSSRVALEMQPAFTRVVLFEKTSYADLEYSIKEERPNDNRWSIYPGDCNEQIEAALSELYSYRQYPTFAFLDPTGLQVKWQTVEKLAGWRADQKTKVELWILFPEPAVARVLGLRGVRGQKAAARLDEIFGNSNWVAIHKQRIAKKITAEGMRQRFVDLYRWQLEKTLGYKDTHGLAITNTNGQPLYTMIFASDHPVGAKIMKHVYKSAHVSTIPMMRAQAKLEKKYRKDDESGKLSLFGADAINIVPEPHRNYKHKPPLPPLKVENYDLDLSDKPDIDPDDFDSHTWAEEQDL